MFLLAGTDYTLSYISPSLSLVFKYAGVHMSTRVYSVESAAKKLNIHPRTVLRFINQGKLKAVKVGRQWRIQGDDLSKILGESKPEKRVESSSVIDIPVGNKQEADRLHNLVMAVLNSKGEESFAPRVDFLFNPDEMRVRFVIWGSIGFMKEFYTLLDKVL